LPLRRWTASSRPEGAADLDRHPIAERIGALRRFACLSFFFALSACRTVAPKPALDAPVVVLVSASAEWRAVRAYFGSVSTSGSPYGESLRLTTFGVPVVFFHGGYGKVAAAGSTQYAIDHFRPSLLVNLGTCGGIAGEAKVGEVVAAGGTIIYDIEELMGDSSEAIAGYSTVLPDLWPKSLRGRVRRERLLSADQDLNPARIGELRNRFGGVAGDWESGAVAFVAARNRVPLLILRIVSDVVSPSGDITYGHPEAFEAAARDSMNGLLRLFQEALPELIAGPKAPPTLAGP
jgi:adenosylhomocysteine nucleosidase